ncbi:alpha/beta hydrolase [Pseudonocardia endophytica]|uniref:Alpha/beta hydrolase family protein n=1 Tax=Pseudonocardia endophytica TaxID=401976 RepID=A0A4R1HLT4_PSEEN|nr:alpha/beta hydrolase [Pseudonocardia endophytica]TCK21270.1 alpha/beta hydrolase family protein [Pseudonocardia endophytica]
MPTYTDLVDVDPTAWLHQARAWDGLAHDLADRADRLRATGARLAETWGGADARAATRRRDELVGELDAAADRAAAVAAVLGRHAGTVMAAQQRVREAVAGVNPVVARVTDDGTVLPVLGSALSGPGAVGLLDAYLREARRVSGVIADALDDAARSDAETVEALHRLAPADPDRPPPGGSLPPDGIPPDGTAPAAVTDWWRRLPATERDRLVSEHPDRIGETDGIPTVDRDRANRMRLDGERIRLRRRRMRLDGIGDGVERDRIDDALDGIDVLERRLALPGTLLLGFDTDGDGRAVVAAGDPDRSDNVVTYVPGVGAGLGAVGIDLSRSDAVAGAARAADPGADTAAVTWIGYRAPSSLPAAAGDRAAHDGGAALVRFQDGLRATGPDDRARLTVLGHSYGSLVAGRAAATGRLAADDLVLVGSPGTGTRGDVTDLRMDPAQVWATVAGNDPINHIPGAPAAGTSDPFPQARQLAYGTDPTDPAFGAEVFASAPGTLGPAADDPDTDDDETSPTAAHGQYWDPGSPSLEAIGRISVGRRDVQR